MEDISTAVSRAIADDDLPSLKAKLSASDDLLYVLHKACSLDRRQLVEWLGKEKKASLNPGSGYAFAGLVVAVENGNLDLAEALVRLGSSLKRPWGSEALHMAVF